MYKIFSVLFSFLVTGCTAQKVSSVRYDSEILHIESVTENVYRHVSYLDVPDFGKVPCNGLIFLTKNGAIVFDTPTTDAASAELIQWIRKEQSKDIKAIVINHFHEDCLGGLQEFHNAGIKSYANNRTIALAKENKSPVPENGFEDKLELHIDNKNTITEFFGAGHSGDNVVSYIPSERTLFGGCMIKEIGAGKGNMADADVEQWPNTVQRIKQKITDIKIVVPGHGNPGGPELFDYTIRLFQQE